MIQQTVAGARSNKMALKTLTFLMFAMFAMTTDSVGIIIREIIKTFRLSLTAAGTFQYATMSGIALAGFLLGHLAGTMCVLLILTALSVRYPGHVAAAAEHTNFRAVSAVMKNRFVLLFGIGVFLYVAVEAAIYVWMPTLLAKYDGPGKWIAVYSISIFFLLRAGGRFLGSWMLSRLSWEAF